MMMLVLTGLSLLAGAPGSPAAPRAPDWVEQRPITWNAEREALTREYRKQHYGEVDPSSSIDPTVIVVHHTAIDRLAPSFEAFNPVKLPGSRKDIAEASPLNVSAHFLVDRDGKVLQLLPTTVMARHTIGLNWTAIGIENVGGQRAELTERQLEANARLVTWLKEAHPRITTLIGHHEYLAFKGTPLFKERNDDYFTRKRDPGHAFMTALRARVASLRLAGVPADSQLARFAQGADRALTRAELEKKSLRELAIERNGVYARHGRAFRTPWVKAWFASQPWYRVNPDYTDELLTDLDRQNLHLVREVENGIGPEELRLRRNTVFARHGRAFKSPDLAAHFAAQPWYKPDPAYTDARLTADDKLEIELIQSFEARAHAVPQIEAWAPGKAIEAKALAGADDHALFQLLARMTVELGLATNEGERERCDMVEAASSVDLCDAWAKGSRPRAKLRKVDRDTLAAVEHALAVAHYRESVEHTHAEYRYCDAECFDLGHTQESRAWRRCVERCEKENLKAEQRARDEARAALSQAERGMHERGIDLLATVGARILMSGA